MACTYIFDGHTFNSEVALDDFLLESGQYLSQLGDIVFSFTSKQNHTYSMIDSIKENSKKEWGKYMEWIADEKTHVYGEDGEVEVVEKPYIGVNEYLASLTDPQLFPEFRKESYWNNRFNSWKNGKFTDSEKEVLGIDPTATEIELKNQYSSATNTQLDEFRNKIEIKWKAQCKSGDAIHEVMQLYFKRSFGKFGFEQPNVTSYILNNMQEKHKKYLPKDSNGNIDISSILEQAKSIHAQLKSELQTDNLMFFPEFIISDEITKQGKKQADKIIGKIDLLVIDAEGKIHIVDYKTSIKNSVDSAKELTYKYQLATYQRMLNRKGVQTYGSKLIVAPIKLNNFRLENDEYIYDNVNTNNTLDVLNIITSKNILDNIEEILPARNDITVTTQEAIETTENWIENSYPKYISDKLQDEKSTIKYLKRRGVFDKKNSNNQYEYQPNDSSEKIVADSEPELVKKVIKFNKSLLPKKLEVTHQIKGHLKKGMKEGTLDLPIFRSARNGISPTWLQDKFSKYCDGNWEIMENQTWDYFGIIALKNTDNKQVDLIRISTNSLKTNHTEFKNNKGYYKGIGLTGKWLSDADENSKADSLMLEAVNGNIELMELMCLLNTTGGLERNGPDGYKIGNIGVINPWQSEMLMPSNEELIYSFNQLEKHNPLKINKGLSFINRFERVHNIVNDIMQAGENKKWGGDYGMFKGIHNSCTSLFDNIADDITVQQQIDKLIELDKILHSDNFKRADELDANYTDSKNLEQMHIRLHREIQLSIAALQGIHFRQQLKDHNKWAESILIWKKGLTGSYTDNAGNLSSETLNLVTKLVFEAYQNIRDEISRENIKLSKYTQKLKDEKGINYITQQTVVNQVNLYKNLFVEKDGDLLFKDINDSSLSVAEKEYLEYALDVINKNRHHCSEQDLKEMKDSYDLKYYRVPLAMGSFDSLASTQNMTAILKEKLKEFNPKYIFEKAQRKIEGIEYIERTENNSNEIIFKMTNMFDCGEQSVEKRLKLIQDVGINNLERNLETLVLKHQFAYSQKEHLDRVFPTIKAATIHLQQEGANGNEVYTQDLKYVKDYIESKILNRSIVDPRMKEANKILTAIRNAASRLTLAFSPVQMFYQPLQGFWQTVSLIARKPDGTEVFSAKNISKAYSIVYKDFFNFSGNPTLISRLNEHYGINDMDMTQFVERILKNKKGIWNMDDLMMKFSNRPDYYNRMVLFVAQMLEDGSFYAHSLNKDGELVYNWKEDKRFEKFAANPNLKTNDPEYNKQKSLYYTVANQFVVEHTKNANGTPFEVNMSNPMPLPRAYTTKEAESIKNVGDSIYGYYSHERKSLIQATALGSMWLQFKTYWSSKKDQYLRKGGVKLQGRFVHKVEKYNNPDGTVTEVKWYYQTDSEGNILKDEPPIPDKKPNENYTGPIATQDSQKIAPYTVWQGQWQEGILLTIADVFKNKHIFDNIKSKWNEENDILRNCYRSNLKQLGIDLFMFGILGSLLSALLGDWLKDLKEENKQNKDFMTGVGIAAANIMVYSVKNSFLDFNFFDSIGSPLGQWTPFAFDWTGRQASNVYKIATGDTDFWDGIVNISSAGKQFKPMFDSLKPDQYRTKREGGTWESATAKRNREKREKQ